MEINIRLGALRFSTDSVIAYRTNSDGDELYILFDTGKELCISDTEQTIEDYSQLLDDHFFPVTNRDKAGFR